MSMPFNRETITFSQQFFLQEINIRGLGMTISVAMEALLFRFMLYSIADDATPVIRDFENMTMNTKIQLANIYFIELVKKNGEYRLVAIKYTIQDIKLRIDKFRKTLLKMAALTQNLVETINHKYPNLSNSSQV